MNFFVKNSYHIEADLRNYIASENKSINNRSINNVISDTRHFIGWLISAGDSTLLRAQQSNKHDFLLALADNCASSVLNNYIEFLRTNKASNQSISRKLSSIKKLESFLLSKSYIQLPFIMQFPTEDKLIEASQPGNVEKLRFKIAQSLKPSLIISATAPLAIVLVTLTLITRTSQIQGGKPLVAGINTIQNNRFVSYSTRVTDSIGNPITSKINARFKIYPSLRSQSVLYDSNYCLAAPDSDGYITFDIGKGTCGTAINGDLFNANPNLYLGVSINNDREIEPRKQLENVSLSFNTRQLGGLSLGTEANSVPYINKEGIVKIDSEMFALESGKNNKEIKIKADHNLNLETGTNGDIALKAGANGAIDFITGTSGLSSLHLSSFGNIGLGTSTPTAFKLESAGSIGPSLSNAYDLGSVDRYWSNLYVRNICFFNQTCVSGAFGSSSNSSALSNIDLTKDLLLGSTSTDSANVKLSASSQGKSFIRSGYFGVNTANPESALQVQGTITTQGNTVDITTIENEDLVLKAGGTGAIKLDSAVTIDLGASGSAYALCHSSQDGTDNQEIVDCVSTPTADFAEMYPVEQGVSYGDLVTLGDQVITTKSHTNVRKLIKASTPYDTHVIGVVSNNYSDFISVGHDIESKDNPMPIALKGRVPVKIALNSENIKASDFITTSTQPGRGMKALLSGMIIGRALEDWSPELNRDSIMVFVGNDYVTNNNFGQSLLSLLETRFQNLIVENNIVSPIIEADIVRSKNLITSNIHISKEDSQNKDLKIYGDEDKPVATISANGNLYLHGTLASQNISSNTLDAKNASISGTLTADSIESTTIKTIQENIADAINKSKTHDGEIDTIKNELTHLKDQPTSSPQWYQDLTQQSVQNLNSFVNLLVTENASMFSANIFQGINSDNNIFTINSKSLIAFFNDSIVLSKDGTITAKGPVIARSFLVKDEVGDEVASIDASGSAMFRRITLENQATPISSTSALIARSDNLSLHGIDAPAIQTGTDTSGVAILPENEKNIVIYNDDITSQSLFFVTPLNAVNTPLYVSEREDCKDKINCSAHITVSTDASIHTDIRFNWLIIDTKVRSAIGSQ